MKRNIIQFQISESDGGYVAEGISVPVVTQGETLDELTTNIQEALALFVADENLSELGFASTPSILTTFELPAFSHA